MKAVLGILAIVAAYFLGNISPAIGLGRQHGVDIKKEGSGNAGTTNVLRVLGGKAALVTMLIDIGKGTLAVELGRLVATFVLAEGSGVSWLVLDSRNLPALCALAVVCGHIWPCLHHFHGGKGVATAFGAILAMNWRLALLTLAVVAVFLLLSKRMSVGSLAGAVAFPILCYHMSPAFFPVSLVIAIVIIYKHLPNIRRLLHGEEPKMSFHR